MHGPGALFCCARSPVAYAAARLCSGSRCRMLCILSIILGADVRSPRRWPHRVDDDLIEYLDADLRDTQPILDQAARILDFSQPVAIMLIAITHAIGDHEDPCEIVARLIGAVPPGSHMGGVAVKR